MNQETVIKDIQQNWSRVVSPLADIKLWDEALKSNFSGCSVFNWTDDFNYSKCHTYEILLHEGTFVKSGSLEEEQNLIHQLGGTKYSILLKMSVVLPYYLTGIFRRNLDINGQINEQVIEPITAFQKKMLQKSEQFTQLNGFKRIERNYLDQVVPNAELELSKKCTIYNCLFEDQDDNVSIVW